ncbi:armadillo-type protein [Polychytrium aggregatum]|uniref:armadillo-type protein n=1 Tax=Polychytrium aggregatum TaxID=110093 RepID=UPI0022FF167A|nr:armadillo-type protein [Polychytrium aggregatum]KAI9193676.1 armadillo-type protein [Polychytrium aggregatum]
MTHTDQNWDQAIESLTQKIEASSIIGPEVFLERAAAYEKREQYDAALNDARTAISIDRQNKAAIETIQRILKASVQKTSADSASPVLLLSRSCVREDDLESVTNPQSPQYRERFASVQRLAMLTSDEDVAKRLVKDGGIDVLIPTFFRERELLGEKAAPSIQAGLLKVLLNLSSISEHGPIMLSFFTSDNIAVFTGSKVVATVHMACDVLAQVVLNSIPSLTSASLADSAVAIVKRLCYFLQPEFDESLRVAGVNGIMKAIGNSDLAWLFVQAKEFESVLQLVDSPGIRLPSLVPVALGRFIELIDSSKHSAVQANLQKYITAWLDSGKLADRTRGLRVLSALFQANSSFGSTVFHSSGVIEQILDCLEFETQSEAIQIAALHVLVDACNEKSCRGMIATNFARHVQQLSSHPNQEIQITAAAISIKLSLGEKGVEASPSQLDHQARLLMSSFVDVACPAVTKSNALEALAYLSLYPPVKEAVCNSTEFLKRLFDFIKSEDRFNQYGAVTVLVNLSNYRKRLSEEEEQVMKLKKMSGEPQGVLNNESPLDDDPRVEKRCATLVKAGAITALVTLSGSPSPSVRDSVCQALLNLAVDKRNRGFMVQQGAVKALMALTSTASPDGIAVASQALAKIAITTDPNLAFKGQRAVELVRPLINLCKGDNELRQFEALMALTNLASMGGDVLDRIVEVKGIRDIQHLQFSDHELVRRAATEALCNAICHPAVFESYAIPSARESNLKVMVALSDVPDFETRRAASGALAILSSDSRVVDYFITEPSGRPLEVLAALIDDDPDTESSADADADADTNADTNADAGTPYRLSESERGELQHRAIECLRNCAKSGRAAVVKMLETGVVPKIIKLLKLENPAVVEATVETLMVLKSEAAKLKGGVDI